MMSLATLLLLGLVSVSKQADESEGEPSYKIRETHTLETPITHKEMDNWETYQSTVLLKNNIVLAPEVKSAKGAMVNTAPNESQNKWLVDAKINIGNEMQTAKGGTGMAMFYVKDMDIDVFGDNEPRGGPSTTGLFGFERRFNGAMVSLNSLFSEVSDQNPDENLNLMQLFVNDGDEDINAMKIRGGNNCKVKFRNLPNNGHFHFRLEYSDPELTLYWYDQESETFKFCAKASKKMDYQGYFLMTANSGMRNPDRYFVESFALYDPSVKVEASVNVHFHEAHKKKSVHDIAEFDHKFHAQDLLHKTNLVSGGDKKASDFSQDSILLSLPQILTVAGEQLNLLTTQFQKNIAYYQMISGPLIAQKTLIQQKKDLESMKSNFTELETQLTEANANFTAYELQVHDKAEKNFQTFDKNMDLKEHEKEKMFNEHIGSLKSSIKLLTNKFDKMKEKMYSIQHFTNGFHKNVLRLESLYLKDIEVRRKQYQEDETVSKALNFDTHTDKPNVDAIAKIFDEIIAEEDPSMVQIICRVPNLLMVSVICMCLVLNFQLNKLQNKNRVD